jgi:uncharacterized protein YceK
VNRILHSCLFVSFVGILLSGCATVRKGDLSVRSLGTDLAADRLEWAHATTSGVASIVIVNGSRDASTTAHTAANLALAALGALAGSSAGPAGTGAGAALGLGAAELWQTVRDALQRPAAAAPSNAPPSAPIAPPAASGTAWPAGDGSRWCTHGEGSGENELREAAIAAGKATGALRVNLPASMPNSSLRIELFRWAHPERSIPGNPWFKTDNWYYRAKSAGISRWVMVLPAGANLAEWADTFKDYSREELQFIVRPDQAAAARAALGNWEIVLEE